jgi:hypothetical protein
MVPACLHCHHEPSLNLATTCEHCAENFSSANSLNLNNTAPSMVSTITSHFIDKEIKTESLKITCQGHLIGK